MYVCSSTPGCALKLLRCGCTVLATSRFASDCARRFAQEQDFSKWSARLHCYGIDFRDLVSVENFCKFVTARFSRLDIIINNACQTIRRPVQYYAHLLEAERQPLAKKTEEERKLLLANEEFVVESGGGRGARRKALEVDEADCVRIEEVEEEEEEAERKSEHEEEEEEKKRACTRGAGKEKEKKKKEGKETEEEDEGRVLEKGMEGEAGSGGAAELSQMVVIEEDKDRDVRKFPQREGGAAVLDVNEQQLDLRGHNSWMLKLNQVPCAVACLCALCFQRVVVVVISRDPLGVVVVVVCQEFCHSEREREREKRCRALPEPSDAYPLRPR
eukprot:3831715-Rhodomonas_salina.1